MNDLTDFKNAFLDLFDLCYPEIQSLCLLEVEDLGFYLIVDGRRYLFDYQHWGKMTEKARIKFKIGLIHKILDR